MRRDSNNRIVLLVALVGILAGLSLVDVRLAAIAGLVVALWMFARSAIALLK